MTPVVRTLRFRESGDVCLVADAIMQLDGAFLTIAIVRDDDVRRERRRSVVANRIVSSARPAGEAAASAPTFAA